MDPSGTAANVGRYCGDKRQAHRPVRATSDWQAVYQTAIRRAVCLPPERRRRSSVSRSLPSTLTRTRPAAGIGCGRVGAEAACGRKSCCAGGVDGGTGPASGADREGDGSEARSFRSPVTNARNSAKNSRLVSRSGSRAAGKARMRTTKPSVLFPSRWMWMGEACRWLSSLPRDWFTPCFPSAGRTGEKRPDTGEPIRRGRPNAFFSSLCCASWRRLERRNRLGRAHPRRSARETVPLRRATHGPMKKTPSLGPERSRARPAVAQAGGCTQATAHVAALNSACFQQSQSPSVTWNQPRRAHTAATKPLSLDSGHPQRRPLC